MFACRFRRQALVVIGFQRFQQGMFGIVTHQTAIGLRVEMSVLFDESVILTVETATKNRHPVFVAVALFLIEQFAQCVPDLNHARQTQAGAFVFDRQNVVIAFAKGGGHLEDNLPALRFHAQRAGLQSLEIFATDEVGVAYSDFRILRAFLARHEAVRRKRLKAFDDFRAEFHWRTGEAEQLLRVHAAVKDHSADDLAGVLEVIVVDDGLARPAVLEVVHKVRPCCDPICTSLVFAVMPLEKYNVGRDIGERVLTKGSIRQADSAEQVGLSRDMLTGCGIDGIHKVAADHKGRDAAFPEEADGLGQEIVVDGEFSQFWEVGIVERLLTERRIADNGIRIAGGNIDMLKSVIDMPRFGIKILCDG